MDRFLIAPYNKDSGLQTDVKPWLIPDNAFSSLVNVYQFRDRIRKRPGSRWLGNTQDLTRFRVQVGTIDTPVSPVPGVVFVVGQMFSAGDQFFTVNVTGTSANMLSNGAGSGTFNTTTGAFTITGTGLPGTTPIFFYPSLPVMGLLTYENNATNDETIIGFDTQFSYLYNGGWNRISGEVTPGAATWTGTNSDFFWGTTWTGVNAFSKIFFVTNFNKNEPNFMRFYDGTNWDDFDPQIDATPNFLICARIIVPFKNRLVVFNTWEGADAASSNNYQNRCRYSQIGSPLDADAWRQDIPGKGNAIDCPTTEAIITVEFVKDRLIVFFERSTWELVYTGNQAYPFVWQQINTELGAESTFSVVPFDKVCLGVGNVGIHACNGSNVERIDDKIPDEVFAIHNNDAGVERVYGIRDYYVEMVYWTFPSDDATSTQPFPNRILAFNYKTGTWAFFDDSITAFGYYQPSPLGVTWDSTTVTWDDPVSWGSGSIQARFRAVIAGNQEGYTFIFDPEESTNAPALQITNITIVSDEVLSLNVINHNMREGEYIFISEVSGSGNMTDLNNTIFQVLTPLDANNFTINTIPPDVITGTYNGGGVISRVNNINISTKQYNFYGSKGVNSAINKVDFLVDSTAAGAIQVNFYVSTSLINLLPAAQGTGTLVGTGTLDTFPYDTAASPIPFEAISQRLWHPVYVQADGEVIQFELLMNDAQMRNVVIRECDFQLHAICIYAMPTSSRFQ